MRNLFWSTRFCWAVFFCLMGASASAQAGGPVAAKGDTQAQVEADVRQALKDILRREQETYANEAHYKPQAELPYALPTKLSGLVKLSISFSGMNSDIKIQLDGIADPILGKKYTINETGTVTGISQFATDSGLDEEIQHLMADANLAMKSYFNEWSMYSTDFQKIGLQVPEHLKKIGTLNIQLTNSGYKIEYLGTAAPIQGKKYSFTPPKPAAPPAPTPQR